MLVELVRITTPDGMRLDGALHAHASAAFGASYDLAIGLHGVGSNFYSSALMESFIAPLAQQGTALLTVNTRGHENITAVTTSRGRRWQGAAFEIVDECRFDVLGWLAWAEERGYRRVLLLGHSLGAIKALYAAAHETLPLVAGIVPLSPPRLSYAHFLNSPDRDKFQETMSTAERLVASGEGESLLLAKFPFPIYITAAGYLDKYGPEERYNFLRFLRQIRVPTLFCYGEQELSGSAFAGLPETIAATPHRFAPLQVVTIADADHVYSGRHEALTQAVTAWMG